MTVILFRDKECFHHSLISQRKTRKDRRISGDSSNRIKKAITLYLMENTVYLEQLEMADMQGIVLFIIDNLKYRVKLAEDLNTNK